MNTPVLFELSRPGRRGYRLPAWDVPKLDVQAVLPEALCADAPPALPELSEIDVTRHYQRLASKSFGVDLGFYPLGSCTMKYNPKVNEETARLSGFAEAHPLQDERTIQGSLKLMHMLITRLCSITGMTWGTLQSMAGAHGEFTGMKLFSAYFHSRGETGRRKLIVPSSSHGTNPASAHLSGFEVVEIPADRRGLVPLASLEPYLNDTLAGIMLTNPNTLGLFEEDILEIAKRIHQAGGLLYYDGANMNAVMGKSRPGDMGFDVIHLNLHKTFSTPHGGGGPGSGPVLVSSRLVPFLPVPDIVQDGETCRFSWDAPQSIGKVSGFYGNFGVLVRALTYILVMGSDGLTHASEMAVLNANYLMHHLKGLYDLPYDRVCKHEFVLSASSLKEDTGTTALDVAKGLIERGIHPPTVYFPLIVAEALMIEPTETETRETLDGFISAMKEIHDLSYGDPEKLKQAPMHTPVRRVDEVGAARNPKVCWNE